MPADPAPAPRALRWGIPDAVWIFFGGLAGSVAALIVAMAVASAAGVTVRKGSGAELVVTAVAGIGQYGAMAGGLVVAARKGWGRLRDDFGLHVAVADWWALATGLGVLIAAGIVCRPLVLLYDRHQAIVDDLKHANGAALVLLAAMAGLVAPVVEELLFRGLLLRSLLRRTGAPLAVAVSAVAFAAVHLLDPNALAILPGLALFGVVSGVLAVRSGNLSRSILLHVGFNSVTVISSLAGVARLR